MNFHVRLNEKGDKAVDETKGHGRPKKGTGRKLAKQSNYTELFAVSDPC